MRWAKRIAQAQPAPDQQPSGDQQPAPDASGAQPAEPAAPAPAPAAPAPEAQAQATGQTPALSDEELAKLAEQEAKTEVITVTGSLIGRKEVDSPSPVSVVDKEKLQSAGITNVGDVLQKIPAQGNAINAQNNNGGDGATRVNLRSLGTARTLVLLNGRRVVSSGLGADASVDFGTIPLAMIERVEVLKDGASAIYGSDAIAGVVNVITRTNMNGTEANVYTSTTNKADGTNYDLSFVTGHSSNRGNITFSGGYQNQKPVMAGDRDFAKQTYSYDFTCTSAMAAAGECIPATLTGSSSSPTGRINTMPNGGPPLNISGCNTRYCTADNSGGFRNFVNATASSFGDNYNFQPLNYLLTPSTRVNLFSNGHYDITKNTHVFFEGQFNSRKSTQQLAEEPVTLALFGTPISAQSEFNPFGQSVVDYNRRMVEFGPRTFNQEVNTSRLVVGLNGNVDETVPALKNWKWEGSYNYGRNDSTQASHGDLILSHLSNSLGPSFHDAMGDHCGTSAADEIDGCVPLNILTPNKATQGAIDYLTFTGTQSGFNEQHTALLTASGKLMDLPNHGDISLAVGGDYRFERGGQQPDPLTATGDTTGNANAPTLGSYHTFEGFGELSIVPISGGEVLKWVEINAAGRAYDYNTFGSGATGKVSGLVRTLGGVAVRGTYGNAFRAPNINELFSGQADSFPLIEDPCDTKPPSVKVQTPLDPMVAKQCAGSTSGGGVPPNSTFGTSQQRSKIGGNPNLQPEKGTVGTAGIVYEPARGLDFTLDYWHVNIDNAITNLPVATILSQCYQAGNDAFCNDITRNPANHTIDHIFDLTQNVGGVSTSGLDFSAAYQYRNPVGTFRHAVEGTYLFKYNVDTGSIDPSTMKEQILHGRGFYDLGVYPDLKFNIFTTWVHQSGVGAGFNFRFVDSYQECDQNNCNDPTDGRRDVSKYATGDVFVTYGLKTSQGTTNITAGMNNVVNVQPPIIYNGAALNADESAYDFLGRQFYVRLAQLF
ncbi:MAG TPA: TonB-dependent receptor [Kofleriaceae bacterium]|nr:TonB-dependent receptor [Kofleriaceae bacterium]